MVVALTGGIASGKTAVSNRFAALGAPVIDTDLIAREVVAPGGPLLPLIADRFGSEMITEDGELDRAAMRRLIFSDTDAQARLEELMHPAIMDVVNRRLEAIEADYCVVVIPLLAESGRTANADRVLVVDVAAETQLQRLMARDGVSEDDAKAALAAQATREERLALADDVIDNSRDTEFLDASVAELHARYTRMASQSGGSPES